MRTKITMLKASNVFANGGANVPVVDLRKLLSNKIEDKSKLGSPKRLYLHHGI